MIVLRNFLMARPKLGSKCEDDEKSQRTDEMNCSRFVLGLENESFSPILHFEWHFSFERAYVNIMDRGGCCIKTKSD